MRNHYNDRRSVPIPRHLTVRIKSLACSTWLVASLRRHGKHDARHNRKNAIPRLSDTVHHRIPSQAVTTPVPTFRRSALYRSYDDAPVLA